MRSMVSSISAKGIAAIVGVGPKLGRSIARKFAHEGYTVAILARDLGRLSRFADEIAREEKAQVFAIRIDCSDPRSVREAFEGVLSLGFVEVLVYNAYQSVSWHPTNFTDIKIDSFEKSLAVSSIGAFLCVQKVPSSDFPHPVLLQMENIPSIFVTSFVSLVFINYLFFSLFFGGIYAFCCNMLMNE
uniref:Uncharacterized protein n=1 Tax=Gossypium raimondii TaxID=29730 RepID=A0A0D2SHF4_GOSRA|nr:hypothetical protein B456_007G210800 [Gossypium raimondii]KJB43655.1 hypothetical protein B456_007G210800 [Gossypium raimondii]